MSAFPTSAPATGVPPWRIAARGAATLAAGMGIGRFVYTPILPLMGLSPRLGAGLATANYLGYLVGAVAAIAVPGLVRSRATLRLSLLLLVATLALMPIATNATGWSALRLIAGVASAMIFVSASTTMLTDLPPHAVGWAIGGVGAGIALSGAAVLAIRATGTWQQAWWSAAALTAALTAFAWPLHTSGSSARSEQVRPDPTARRSFAFLLVSYSLEGVGYIIAGTFLVAAIEQTAPGWAGTGAWILVGLAALPSSAFWAWLSHTWSRRSLLVVALLVQAVGIALPAVAGGVVPALISATLFGATFLGVNTTVLSIGAHLRIARSVAILTTGYSVGQVLGPLAVNPFLHHGYHTPLLLGAALVTVAATTATASHR
ncbi:MFS transporter [Kribbella sp. ALI-6-A]|uniref:YbfB/YjiJ family MFS transporter n=1 Tax=Kribbella sp. ALI-6-A TaxID=1933817 RepID=UPI00097C7324|nr:YbfB/YjiJ family MFS transporter [Kribbella sp. ALI-6-A]ONI68758.1 MFS transporter [Kribbella sp. ALI-6-A]